MIETSWFGLRSFSLTCCPVLVWQTAAVRRIYIEEPGVATGNGLFVLWRQVALCRARHGNSCMQWKKQRIAPGNPWLLLGVDAFRSLTWRASVAHIRFFHVSLLLLAHCTQANEPSVTGPACDSKPGLRSRNRKEVSGWSRIPNNTRSGIKKSDSRSPIGSFFASHS